MSTPTVANAERPRKEKKNDKKQVVEDVERKKFPTSEEVYQRILWDDRFNANMFEIGYEDRFRGLMYMPLRNFRGTGDETSEVPYHRVQLVRCGDQLVWDRATRLYNLEEFGTSSTAPAFVAAPSEARESPKLRRQMQAVPIQPGYWNGVEWASGDQVESTTKSSETLKLLTFNMLFSNFEVSIFCPSSRISIFLKELEREDADIVSLQEVTPDAWNLIKASDFVKRTYHICDVPGRCVQPTGQAILSKFPFSCAWILPFGPVKRGVFGRVTSPMGELTIAAVHLSSDFSRDNAEARIKEYGNICLEFNGHSIIMGDFNFGDEAPENEKIHWMGFTDVWKAADVAGDSDGFTFDLTANWMAERNAKNHRYPRRLDRILIKSPILKPISAAVCLKATEVHRIDGKEIDIFASDHFGVSCQCEILADVEVSSSTGANEGTSSAADVEVSAIPRNLPLYVRSTVCILATPESWDPINGIRQTYDPVFLRWPPHINLLYPFAAESDFEMLAPILQRAISTIEPFTIFLEDLETFGGRSKYIFAHPDKASTVSICALYKSIVNALPMCSSGKEFSPHLTVAQFDAQNPVQKEMGKHKLLQTLRAQFAPVEFKVTHIHMMARDGNDQPFRVVHSIPLCRASVIEFPSPWDIFPGWPPIKP